MTVSTEQSILIIAICALCTFSERLLPFLVFRKGKLPNIIVYIGKYLPTAVILTLVVYCCAKSDSYGFCFYPSTSFGCGHGAPPSLEEKYFVKRSGRNSLLYDINTMALNHRKL